MTSQPSTSAQDGFYWEVLFDCPEDFLDLFSLKLFENGSSGFEEISRGAGKVRLKAFFQNEEVSDDERIRNLIDEVLQGAEPVSLVSIEKKTVENWQSNWKKHFLPIEIGSRFLVVPPWAEVTSQRLKIVIRPGMGFGTGYHESTNIALCLLEWVAENQTIKRAIDIGAGSGILSIGALKLGVEHVTAIDIDEKTEKEIKTNLELSGVDPSRCYVRIADPSALDLKKPDLVMANIEGHILAGMKNDLIRLTGPGGLLLMSGILKERNPELLQCFEEQFETIKEICLKEWYGVVLRNIESP